MIRHQAIGRDTNSGAVLGFRQDVLKRGVVRGLLKQRESPNSTVEDMIGKIASCEARPARHGSSSSGRTPILSRKDSRPLFDDDPFSTIRGEVLGLAKPLPEFSGAGKACNFLLLAGQEVILDDPVPVGRVGKLQPKYSRVVLCLLQPIPWGFVRSFRLNHADEKVAGVPQKIVRSLLRTATDRVSRDDDATVCEGLLFGERMRVVIPARFIEFREDVLSAGIGFGNHKEAR